MVGPSGLEPPTSCLSGTRSNLLSYEPLRRDSHLSAIGTALNSTITKIGTKVPNGGDDGDSTVIRYASNLTNCCAI